LAIDPLSEPAHHLLMGALAATGERASAVDAYEDCRRLPRTTLDIEPSLETVALGARLRHLPAGPSTPLGTGPTGGRPAARSFAPGAEGWNCHAWGGAGHPSRWSAPTSNRAPANPGWW
jgi:hypothetical protein